MTPFTFFMTAVIMTLAFTTGGISQHVGDICCLDDFVTHIATLQTAFKDAGSDLTKAEFQTRFKNWTASVKKYSEGDPEGLCGGGFNFKCEENPSTGKAECKCNDEGALKYSANGQKECLGDLDSVCYEGDPKIGCSAGNKCGSLNGEKIGVCEGDAERTGINGTGTGGTGGGGGGSGGGGSEKSGANTPTPTPLLASLTASLALVIMGRFKDFRLH